MRVPPLHISAYSLVCAAGSGRDAVLDALRERRSGLTPNDFTPTPLPTWIGRVPGLESQALPAALAYWDCRINRLAWRALGADGFLQRVLAARQHYGARRIALIVGTSTAGIGETEQGYRELEPDGQFPPALRRPIIHAPHAVGEFVQHALALEGLCVTIATACSSSAKVFAYAERLMRLGLADAAIVGGADTLCDSVLYGFNSLEIISADRCRPFDTARKGINLGEAAGFALLERDATGPRLLGHGESSDAYHMSAPHPEGAGARAAITRALESAGVAASEVDYINLHGTATPKNDEIEGRVVAELFPATTRASSTKGWTGHTLGAAGIVEAVISLLALEHAFAPGTLNTTEVDPVCGARVCLENQERPIRRALSNSFGFGGSNCSLLFGV